MQDKETPVCSTEPAGVKNLEAEFDVETAKELARAFLDDTNSLIGRMNEALERKDLEGLRASAHMLKGCARALQAGQCEKVSAALESFARDGDEEGAKETLQVLTQVYEQTAEFLRNYTS